MKFNHIVLISLISASADVGDGQVCSPIGQLCTRTTECCKGCCEAHTCVDRKFPCSTDLISQPGFNSCVNYFCPPGQICFLREICPPENPCPRQPSCRRVDMIHNYSDWQLRNSFERKSAGPVYCYFSISILILGLVGSVFI